MTVGKPPLLNMQTFQNYCLNFIVNILFVLDIFKLFLPGQLNLRAFYFNIKSVFVLLLLFFHFFPPLIIVQGFCVCGNIFSFCIIFFF